MQRLASIVLPFVLVLPLIAFQRPQGPLARRGTFTISGQVVDDEGKPVSAQVQAWRAIYDLNGEGSLTPVGRPVVTDAMGHYRVNNLAADLYFVSAETSTGGRGVRPSAPVYHPDVTDWRSAKPVEASRRVGENVADIRVPKKGMFRVSGTLIDNMAPGAVASSFYLSLAGDESDHLWQVANRDLSRPGSFQIDGVPPGTYDVYPTMTQPGGKTHVGHFRITVQRDLPGIAIQVPDGVNLIGQIQARRYGGPAVDLSKLKIGIVARKGEQVSPPPEPVLRDGAFRIPFVPEMEYQLEVSGLPDGTFVESAMLDGAEALNSWFPVKWNSQRLDIVLDTAGAEVRGKLIDMRRQAYAGTASVVLVPLERKGNLASAGIRIGRSDENGRFVVNAVPPGDYRMLAWSNPNGRPFFNPVFMKGYLGMGEVVHVYRGSRVEADAMVVDSQ